MLKDPLLSHIKHLTSMSECFFLINIDKDECKLKLHSCSQKCVNIDGGYRCDCNAGFNLAVDGKTCLGNAVLLLFRENSFKVSYYTSNRLSFVTFWAPSVFYK